MKRNERETALLGTLVRPARVKQGMTQQELGDLIGMDKGYLSSIEVGRRAWPREYVEALAEALGLDLVEMAVAADVLPGSVLRRRTGDPLRKLPPTDPLREAMLLAQEMPIEERRTIRDYVAFVQAKLRAQAAPEKPRDETRGLTVVEEAS